uniref:Sodium-coupled monocarboxylate transporter 1 n=1 Tax=Magallana gigas TaxID=29159 RepID=K1PI14_MAGGI
MVLKEENSSQDPKACADVLSRCKSRRLAPESVTNSLRIQEVAFLLDVSKEHTGVRPVLAEYHFSPVHCYESKREIEEKMLKEATFGVADYVVSALALCISLSIGLYYACSGGRQATTAEYHLGNRNLNFLPVMFSLMVTSQSSILILGVPAETYLYGFLATISGFGFWFAYWLCARIVIPIVHPIRITSVNEYFNLRYKNNRVRFLTTVLSFIFWGGIKAVIWTDVIQYSIMLTSVLAILIKGSMKVGGGSEVIRINSEGKRLDFWNFSLDPTLRYTMWNVMIGNTAKLFYFPLSQSSVQRIGCMPTIKDAYKMFYIVAPLMGLTFFLAGSMGLVSYAYFVKVKCDPLASKFIKNPNQLAQMVMTIPTGPYTGIFLYSIFCTSATSAGAILGGIVSLVFYLWMAIGMDKQFLTEGFNQIYGMSFQWFDFIAIIIVFVVGLITSKIVGAPKEEDVDASFKFDLTLRYTIWNIVIGNTAKLLFLPLSQSSVQRIGCMPTLKDAYKMFYIVAPLMGLSVFLAGGMGLVSYAYFVKDRCDPLASKLIKNPNQILPTLVTEIFQNTPGMTGLFIAGLFCASLSYYENNNKGKACFNRARHPVKWVGKTWPGQNKRLAVINLPISLKFQDI